LRQQLRLGRDAAGETTQQRQDASERCAPGKKPSRKRPKRFQQKGLTTKSTEGYKQQTRRRHLPNSVFMQIPVANLSQTQLVGRPATS
jgi:hypothetical protein